MNINSSIYIPRMSIDYDENSIRNIMEYCCIGTVSHIDFTPIDKKPGFGENVDKVVKSAFIHFSDPCFCGDKLNGFQFRRHIKNDTFWSTIASNRSFKLQVSSTEYWICLKNRNPVQRTMMNIHQVVENGRHLENLIKEQNKQIQHLEQKIENMDAVMRQLIGGLFCHASQKSIMELYNQVLSGNISGVKSLPEDNTHRWNYWPTTRQGDECEKRITELENYLVENEKQDSDLVCRKKTWVDNNSERITALEERLNTLETDLDTYDILRYSQR